MYILLTVYILKIIYDIDDNDGIVFKFFCTGIPSPQKIEQLRAIGAEL